MVGSLGVRSSIRRLLIRPSARGPAAHHVMRCRAFSFFQIWTLATVIPSRRNRFLRQGLIPLGSGQSNLDVKKSRKRKRQLSESEWLQHTAVHEAGHAVMAVHFRFPLKGVSIEADGFKAGFCKTPEAGEIMTQHPDAL